MTASSHVSYLYASANFFFAGLCAVTFFWLAPGRGAVWPFVAGAICLVMVSSGIAMAVPHRWGRRMALGSALLLLLVCATLIALLVASAAYLHAIYGGVGQAGAVLAIVAAALLVEALGLVPALQLIHLRRTRR